MNPLARLLVSLDVPVQNREWDQGRTRLAVLRDHGDFAGVERGVDPTTKVGAGLRCSQQGGRQQRYGSLEADTGRLRADAERGYSLARSCDEMRRLTAELLAEHGDDDTEPIDMRQEEGVGA